MFCEVAVQNNVNWNWNWNFSDSRNFINAFNSRRKAKKQNDRMKYFHRSYNDENKTRTRKKKEEKPKTFSTIGKEAANDVEERSTEKHVQFQQPHIWPAFMRIVLSLLTVAVVSRFAYYNANKFNEWKAKESISRFLCKYHLPLSLNLHVRVRLLYSERSARQQNVTISFYWFKNSFRFYYRIYVVFCWLLQAFGSASCARDTHISSIVSDYIDFAAGSHWIPYVFLTYAKWKIRRSANQSYDIFTQRSIQFTIP